MAVDVRGDEPAARPDGLVCPWCREPAHLALSPEDEGTMTEDCHVCCRPWQVLVWRAEGEGSLRARIERA